MATNDTTTTESPRRQTERVETPIHITPETWDRIVTLATETLEYDPEAHAGVAFWDAVHEFVEEDITVIVDGDAKTPADVPGADVDADSSVATERAHIQASAEYRPESEVPLHITVSPPEDVLNDVGSWDELTETARLHLGDRPGDE